MFRYLFLALLIFCTLNSCSNPKNRASQTGKLRILTTISMIEDLVVQIAKERVDVDLLIRRELDPHTYELVKGDDEKFARADLIFCNGLGLEHGLSLRQNLEGNPKTITLADAIIKEDPSLILKIDDQYDPHIWLDISLWSRCIDPIVSALSEKDPEYASYYAKNGASLKKLLQQADEKAYQELQAIASEKRYLVTSHDAFNYFTRRYLKDPNETVWHERCKAPEGLAPEAQMSVSDILKVLVHIEKNQIGVLFAESNVNTQSLHKILNASQSRGFKVRLAREQLYGDSMGKAHSYIEMMEHNVELMLREWTDA